MQIAGFYRIPNILEILSFTEYAGLLTMFSFSTKYVDNQRLHKFITDKKILVAVLSIELKLLEYIKKGECLDNRLPQLLERRNS